MIFSFVRSASSRWQSVYQAYVQHLMDNNQIEQAVGFFERIYTTANDWEEQIRSFIQRNKLDVGRRFSSRSPSLIVGLAHRAAHSNGEFEIESGDLRIGFADVSRPERISGMNRREKRRPTNVSRLEIFGFAENVADGSLQFIVDRSENSFGHGRSKTIENFARMFGRRVRRFEGFVSIDRRILGRRNRATSLERWTFFSSKFHLSRSLLQLVVVGVVSEWEMFKFFN